MSYLVLARKYRPQKFDELIGQEHIINILKKSVEKDKTAQGYLFTGPRGVGKTSCARILAKSLNCQTGSTTEPCETCSSCKEISGGNSFDVLEIDGASNRGIDEIRALRENIKFAPSFGKYKIYIVDEVHMLTSEAFNALLKTLEEPPEHVKFIFATTAPNKVPATIISRCQRFDFKRITLTALIDTLRDIAKKENLNIEDDAYFAIAKAAQGGLRDALSILDQVSALSDSKIMAEDIYSMLGMVEVKFIFELTDALAQKNCKNVFQLLDDIINQGKDVKQLIKDLIEHFRNLMVIKVGGKSLGKLVDFPVEVKEMILTQTTKLELKDIINFIDCLIETQDISRITESNRLPLEVAFAKLTYVGEKERVAASVAVSQQTKSPISNNKAETSTPRIEKAIDNEPEYEPDEKNVDPASDIHIEEYEEINSLDNAIEIAKMLDISIIKKNWDSLTYAVSKEKMSLATFLQEGSPLKLKGNDLFVGFSSNCKFHKETCEDNANKTIIENIFAEKLGTKLLLKFIIAEGDLDKDEDPEVKKTLDIFKGKVVSRWHNE